MALKQSMYLLNLMKPLRKLDEVIGHFTKDRGVTAVLKQADRIIRAYVKGMWITPAPKDVLLVKEKV